MSGFCILLVELFLQLPGHFFVAQDLLLFLGLGSVSGCLFLRSFQVLGSLSLLLLLLQVLDDHVQEGPHEEQGLAHQVAHLLPVLEDLVSEFDRIRLAHFIPRIDYAGELDEVL